MAYSLEEEDNMLSLFESIANQPIEQQRPYNETSNPRPIVESTAMFEGKKVDLSTWTTDSKKVGKAKTAVNPDLSKGNKAAKGAVVETKASKEQVTENDVVTEKKEDKKVTKLVTDDTTHEAKGEPKAKSGSFDSKAKSTASAQRSKADSNKKFSEESKRQRKIDMFRDFVKSLGIDEKSKADAEKVLKKFDQISKHIGEPGDGKVKPKLESINQPDLTEDALNSGIIHQLRVIESKLGEKVPGIDAIVNNFINGHAHWKDHDTGIVFAQREYDEHKDLFDKFAEEAANYGLTVSFRPSNKFGPIMSISW